MSKNQIEKKPDINEKLDNAARQYSDATLLLHEMVAQKAGMTGADHKYLGILIQNGAMTAGDLATITGLTTGAITGVIDRLVKKKLASREGDPLDRRKVIVVPNEESASKLLAPIFSRLTEKMAGIYNQFSENEVVIILRYLENTSNAIQDLIAEMKAET